MLQKLTADFLQVLVEARKHRSETPKWVGDELEWVIYERKVMLQAINAVRLQRKRPRITIEELRQVEEMAVVDYNQKFALHCAQLALRLW